MNPVEGDCPAVGTVAIIGGGASGVLAATHLLARARQPVDVVIVEPSGRIAEGPAYGTDERHHLLNAPSSDMSAWSDRPGDFTAFASARGYSADGRAFVARGVYRDYLRESLRRAARQSRAGGAELLAEEAVAVVPASSFRPDRRFIVGMRHGSHLEAAHVILAIGAPAPMAPWLCLESPPHPSAGLIVDPWARGALEAIGSRDRVLLLGTGLTMVDVALALRTRFHQGRMLARSRHGLLPLRHLEIPAVAKVLCFDGSIGTARELFGAVRSMAEKAEFATYDWRDVIAGVRRELPTLWAALPLDEQRRLLRHGRRLWEVHRHRMAPQVGRSIEQLVEDGRLQIGRGHLVEVEDAESGFLAQFESGGRHEQVETDFIVNCSGYGSSDYVGSALVQQLLRSNLAVLDETGLGLRTDRHGDLLGPNDSRPSGPHAIGWMRSGQQYESSGIPEIREQAERLADRIIGEARWRSLASRAPLRRGA